MQKKWLIFIVGKAPEDFSFTSVYDAIHCRLFLQLATILEVFCLKLALNTRAVTLLPVTLLTVSKKNKIKH